MRDFSIQEIAQITGGRIISGSGDSSVRSVSKDSRSVGRDTLFFALIGQHHNAHQFLPQVLQNGCTNWVVSEATAVLFPGGETANVVLVEDTQEALIALAVYVLDEMNAVKIGVTGSVGKTSTKDMIHAVCSQKYITGKTHGNLNTNIGISMCVLDFDPKTEVAVLEMGTDHPGEIDRVVQVFRPHIGLITNIGQSHLEHFITREGIFRAKLEIANYFKPDDLLIIAQGEDYLRKERIPNECRIQSVGLAPDNDFIVSGIESVPGNGTAFNLSHQGRTVHFSMPVPGLHQAINAAQAAAVGVELGISLTQAAKGLSELKSSGGRLDLKQEKGFRNSVILDDAYNASPDSMRAGIRTLMSIPGPRKVAILGDMYELGVDSRKYHQEVGQFASTSGVDLIIGVGALAKDLADAAGPSALYFEDKIRLLGALPELIQDQDVILIKASRVMALDEVVEYLLDKKETE